MNAKRGLKTKVTAAIKYFFTGDDELFTKKPSSARELSSDEINMVTGGEAAAASAYLNELSRKYGADNKFDALERATEEERLHHIELLYR